MFRTSASAVPVRPTPLPGMPQQQQQQNNQPPYSDQANANMDPFAKLNNALTLAQVKPKPAVRLLSISNFDVPSGSATNDFEVKVPFTGQIVEARLVSTFFVNSQYPVFSGNNQFSVTQTTTAPPGTTTSTITITAGSYDGATLATLLQTAFNALNGGADFTVTFSTSAQAFTISRVNGTFAMLLGNLPNSMAEVLGFARSNQTSGTTATSTLVALLTGVPIMKIRCPQLENMDMAAGDRYFAEVQWTDTFNVRHTNTFVTNPKLFKNGQIIPRLHFQFENDTVERTLYEFNGSWFRMDIEFIFYA